MDEDVVEIYTLWGRLKERFSLVRSQPKSFSLKDTVQPVTNVDFALFTTEIHEQVGSVSSAGYKEFAQVPAGKRWEVYATHIYRAGGNYDFASFHITDSAKSDRLIYYRPSAAGSDILYYHPCPLPLSEGYRLGFLVTNYVAAANAYCNWYIKETNMEE